MREVDIKRGGRLRAAAPEEVDLKTDDREKKAMIQVRKRKQGSAAALAFDKRVLKKVIEKKLPKKARK